MLYVMAHLSTARLAPKLLEQVQLPLDTSPEARLLLLIARVPGLQKLGQVIARNHKLSPSLREALSELENGIRDVGVSEIRAVIHEELGRRLRKYAVEIEPAILSEASVSAVLRFTWRNAETSERQSGVFKVLKPHVPDCFAEDMDILQGLAEHFSDGGGKYGFAANVLTDTFTKVRRLLEHEVDFAREQKTLLEGCGLYRAMPGIRVPQLIPQLCTAKVTAMSEEPGGKFTDGVRQLPAWRRRPVAQRLIEALIAAPLLTGEDEALFHADPHAGNLLYDRQSGDITILDWALTERLQRDQRRHLAVLAIMVGLRNEVGASNEIIALSQNGRRRNERDSSRIRSLVGKHLAEMPVTHLPGAVDAMRLLERVAISGVRFPGPLIMFSKAVFTLEDILREIRGTDVSIGAVLGRALAHGWLTQHSGIGTPLRTRDWVRVQMSALLLGGRLWVLGEQMLLDRLLSRSGAEEKRNAGEQAVSTV
jgi:predicted unusual protein kinase regulating ubiquinone biosynthesis (AarF/ABC1/UbiB family)